jgi:hypothetical protein
VSGPLLAVDAPVKEKNDADQARAGVRPLSRGTLEGATTIFVGLAGAVNVLYGSGSGLSAAEAS